MRIGWLLLTSMLVVAACKTVEEPEPSPLVGTDWVLVYSEDFAGVRSTPADGLFTLEFNASEVLIGTSDCNSIGGSYHSDDDHTSLSITSSTKVLCENPYSEVYPAELNGAKIIELTPSEMIVQSKQSRQQLHFKPAAVWCESPLNVSDEVHSPISLTVKEDIDLEAFVRELEVEYPDFTPIPGRHCSRSLIAEVNQNTLVELRCREGISTISTAVDFKE